MSIPEACIEAAHICQPTAEVRARRVILALAENPPESAVEKALEKYFEYWSSGAGRNHNAAIRAAIVAALKDVVEGK